MTTGMEEINNFAKTTLGKVPEIVDLLGKIDENLAIEQFRENKILYLGRKNTEGKLRALIAIAVSAANGQKDSVNLHFTLAEKFGAEPLEVLDALKIAKMALMSSTMASLKASLPIIEGNTRINRRSEEVEKIVSRMKTETGMENLPENLLSLSRLSFDLFSEHLKEKSELMTPSALDRKSAYLIAYAVSVAINSEECTLTYLKQFFRAGGTVPEIEDALAVSRFITGNRAFISSAEVLRKMSTQNVE